MCWFRAMSRPLQAKSKSRRPSVLTPTPRSDQVPVKYLKAAQYSSFQKWCKAMCREDWLEL
eukprot:m.60318 g.60318  ORF g.60318 m.60318 type:complete len:61 (+) comp13850_c0_seq4:109-291(+)